MKLSNEKRRLITKVAYMYYVEGYTQKDISKKLGIYRTTIGRMLTKAKKYHIVEITINGYDTQVFELEDNLKSKYGLKQAIVVPNSTTASNEEKDIALAKAGLQHLKRNIKKGDVVGFSWGKILREMADVAKGSSNIKATFIPLAGGPSSANTEYHVNGIVYDIARKFGGQEIFIDSSAVQPNAYVKKEIMNTSYFRAIKNFWHNLSLAYVGIGGPLNGNVSRWRDLLTLEDVNLLKERYAVGDCCCTFYDRDGKIVKGELLNRTIAIPLAELKKARYSVGIARSLTKAVSIDRLMNMHILNTLITDEETAQRMLEI